MFTRAPFSLSSSLKQFAVCLFGISSPPACLAHSHGGSFSSPVRLSVSLPPPLSADRRPSCQYTPAEVYRSDEIVVRLSVISVRTDQHPKNTTTLGCCMLMQPKLLQTLRVIFGILHILSENQLELIYKRLYTTLIAPQSGGNTFPVYKQWESMLLPVFRAKGQSVRDRYRRVIKNTISQIILQ